MYDLIDMADLEQSELHEKYRVLEPTYGHWKDKNGVLYDPRTDNYHFKSPHETARTAEIGHTVKLFTTGMMKMSPRRPTAYANCPHVLGISAAWRRILSKSCVASTEHGGDLAATTTIRHGTGRFTTRNLGAAQQGNGVLSIAMARTPLKSGRTGKGYQSGDKASPTPFGDDLFGFSWELREPVSQSSTRLKTNQWLPWAVLASCEATDGQQEHPEEPTAKGMDEYPRQNSRSGVSRAPWAVWIAQSAVGSRVVLVGRASLSATGFDD